MARRGTGEGSIYRDAEGYWRSAITVGWTVEGQPVRKTFRSRERAVVSTKLAKAIEARDRGTLPTGKVPTVAAWLEHWLTVVAPERIRPSTARGYRTYVDQYLVPLLGRHRLDRLRSEHIETAWAELRAQGKAPATVRQAHRILSRALTIAVRRGHIVRNPAARELMDGPSAPRTEARFYVEEDAARLVAAAEGDRLATRWTAGLGLGLRQGEALGLTWDDVDLERGTLTIRRALQRHTYEHGCGGTCDRKRAAECPQRAGGGLVFVEPKSQSSRRTVAMPVELTAALRARRAEHRRERLAAGPLWRGREWGELVWCQLDGGPIDPRADWAAWRRLCAAAGLEPLRLHDARHTAASLLLAQDVHPRVVQEVLGHSSIQLTLGTYSHVAPKVARAAADAVSRALWTQGGGST